ncbi:MAG: tetratricopeptide repeat protein, partial [Gammaproteobacteria bacterium]
TVRTLSEDIQRYLEDRPVLARPDTFQYRTGKFMSRHRYRLALAAVALVVVASLVGFYTWRLSAERDLVIQERDTAERTADFLVSLFEESDPEVSRGQSVSARELLDRGAENISGRLADEPQLRARLMYAMARVYFGLGQYDEADEFAVRVVDDLRRDDERSALSLADALILQGNIATARNDFENAGQYYERGLEIYRRETGDGDTNTLTALVAIGEMQFRYGRTAESIANCERANAGITGATDPARLTVSARAKLCLGRAYLIDARPDEAQAALEEARSILIGLHGDDHPDVAVAEHELGAVQHHLGNYPDAKAHYARSLEIMRRIYGESHTRLADPLTEMADVRSLTGDYEQAEKEIGEALDILRSKFGDDHTLVAISLHVKGNIMLDQGRNAEGEQLFRESLAILERLLEPKHEYFPMVLNGLASSLEFQGKFDEAETHYREAVRLAQAHQDPNYLDAIINVSNLGAMLASKGDFERALPFMQEAVERGVDNYGAEHPDVVIFKHAYGKALGYLERYDEASRILDEVGTDFRRIYGEDHYRYANWTSDRGQLCLAMNDLPCAERMLDDAIRMKEKILGTDHTSYAVTLYETARLQLAKGDPAEARRRAEQSLAILEASELPDTHINIVRTRTLLANL